MTKQKPRYRRTTVFVKNLFARPFESPIQFFCLFIGYPGSGHSIVGALLDAHPNCAISHELNVAGLVEHGFKGNAIFRKIIKNTVKASSSGRRSKNYRYQVENQYQGRFTNLRVIGDKKGGRTSQLLAQQPELLENIGEKVNVPLKIIHVYRHPLDNIASRLIGGNTNKTSPATIQRVMEKHFVQLEANARVIADRRFEVFNIKHEEFVADPKTILHSLCKFLELNPDESYLDNCSAIVFRKPHQRRQEIDFPEDLQERIIQESFKYEFLRSYF